jgi:hypothetical protein
MPSWPISNGFTAASDFLTRRSADTAPCAPTSRSFCSCCLYRLPSRTRWRVGSPASEGENYGFAERSIDFSTHFDTRDEGLWLRRLRKALCEYSLFGARESLAKRSIKSSATMRRGQISNASADVGGRFNCCRRVIRMLSFLLPRLQRNLSRHWPNFSAPQSLRRTTGSAPRVQDRQRYLPLEWKM